MGEENSPFFTAVKSGKSWYTPSTNLILRKGLWTARTDYWFYLHQTAEDLTKLTNMCPIKVIWCWMCLDISAFSATWKDGPNHGAHWQSHRTRGREKLSLGGLVLCMAWWSRSRRGLEVSVYQQDQLQGAQGLKGCHIRLKSLVVGWEWQTGKC